MIVVGAIDIHDVAHWVELAMDYVAKHPDDAKIILREQFKRHWPAAKIDTEKLNTLLTDLTATGKAFIESVDQASEKVEQMVAQAEVAELGKDKLN